MGCWAVRFGSRWLPGRGTNPQGDLHPRLLGTFNKSGAQWRTRRLRVGWIGHRIKEGIFCRCLEKSSTLIQSRISVDDNSDQTDSGLVHF